MSSTGSKNQPLVNSSDQFNPASDINNVSNYAADFANFRVVANSTERNALPSAKLTNGLVVLEIASGEFWQYTTAYSWQNLGIGRTPRIDLSKTIVQTIASAGTWYTINSWTHNEMRGGFSESGGNITVPYTGRYNIFGFISWTGTTADGARGVRIQVNGVTEDQFVVTAWTETAQTQTHLNMTGFKLNAGDTICLQAYETAGSNLNTTGSSIPERFVIEYLGF